MALHRGSSVSICTNKSEVIFLQPKELDVVLLQDGREVTVLEVLGNDEFYVEYDMPDKDDCEWFTVKPEQIEKIIWSSKS